NPMTRPPLGILIPRRVLTRQANSDDIHPSVLIDIQTEIQKSIAVLRGRQIVYWRSYLMPDPTRRLKPIGAGDDIRFPIIIDISDRHTLRKKITGQYMLYKSFVHLRFTGIL